MARDGGAVRRACGGLGAALSAALAACASLPRPPAAATPALALRSLIPLPESVQPGEGGFELTPDVRISVAPASDELLDVAGLLAERLRAATGYAVPVVDAAGAAGPGGIHLTTLGSDPELGEEGYGLTVTPEGAALAAPGAAGLFRGIQTIRQLLPPAIESSSVQPGPWRIAAGTIRDRPRFPWRGAMLDVARHFFGVADVERFIDLLAYYKMNRLHLHLSDDQGWRLVIAGWPQLTGVGGTTQVGGGTGAFYYSQADYVRIVEYARRRHVVVVPEIDMPGHTNAALASYPALNCDGVARPPYTGIEVGFSSLCLEREQTLSFVDDVVREIAALTPGPYFHVGGDEAKSTDAAAYAAFIDRVQSIVSGHGKTTVGWEEIAAARLHPGTIVQQWDRGVIQQAVRQGARVILSPAKRAYLDMKYDAATALGQDWAGRIEVRDAYDWEPAADVAGVSERDVLGVEAPLWTETLTTIADEASRRAPADSPSIRQPANAAITTLDSRSAVT